MKTTEYTELVFWYLPAAPGARRPERDMRGPLREPQRRGLPATTRPAGILLAAERGADAAVTTATLCAADPEPGGMPTALAREQAERCFGHEAVAAAAARARRREAELQHTPAAVRRAAVATLRGWMDAAAASAGANGRWTGLRAPSATLQERYSGQSSGRLSVDAASPHCPDVRPREIRLRIDEPPAPTIEVRGLGLAGPEVFVAGQRCELPLRDIETACVATAADAARMRPPAPTMSTALRAGALFRRPAAERTGERLTLWAANGDEQWTVEADSRWLIERLGAYALPRDQQDTDPYDRSRAWELDTVHEAKPAVLVERGDRIEVLGERGRWLDEQEAADCRSLVESVRARSGADRFWTDRRTTAVLGFRCTERRRKR